MQELTRLRQALADDLDKRRRDWLLFSGLTIFLTPPAIVVAILVVFMAMLHADLPLFDHPVGTPVEAMMQGAGTMATALNIFLAFMFVALFTRGRHETRWSFVYMAGGLLAGLLLLSYGTGLTSSEPGLFWALYGTGGILFLGLLGAAYCPGETYYQGIRMGPGIYIDNPLTTEDDMDRAHFALGFAVGLPRMIVGSYGSIFGNLWLIHGLERDEEAAAAGILKALCDEAREPGGTYELIRSLGPREAARALRALEFLELIRLRRNHLKLTSEGMRFVSSGGCAAARRLVL